MKWQIEINNPSLGGYAPAYYNETYPSYGNNNQAGAMQNMDLTNAGFITQGPGLSNLTNGTEAGVVSTLIRGLFNHSVGSTAAYGVGGAKLYKLSSTTVTSDATWPHAIDKGGVTAEDGEDVIEYKGNLYYTYNHSGAAGDIGKYNLDATFDDDWGSTVPTGAAALSNNATIYTPHQMVVGGNDVLYITNKQYIASYDNTTLVPQALDFSGSHFTQSAVWASDRLWISANRYNFDVSDKPFGSVYIWDGTTDSWETEIVLSGKAGPLYVKDGIIYVFYQDASSTGGYKLGYLDGTRVNELASFTGALPAYYQISDHKGFLIWNANGSLFAWGSGDKDLPARVFQYADGGHATVGCVSSPFGTPLVASYDGASAYRLAKFSGYDTSSNWKSLLFDVTGYGKNSKVEVVRINFESLSTGARVDWKLLNNQGVTVYSDLISFAKNGTDTSVYVPLNGKVTNNFRFELDYSNGSATNPVKIRNVKIYGATD